MGCRVGRPNRKSREIGAHKVIVGDIAYTIPRNVQFEDILRTVANLG